MILAHTEPSTSQRRAEFGDIPRIHWARSAANQLAKTGIMEGDSQGRFNGDAPLKRADFAIVLSRLNSRRSSLMAIPEWAKEQKIYFTRYEFAVAMSRVFHFINPSQPPLLDSAPSNQLNGFKDIPKNHWACLAANQIAGFGIVEGDSQGQFKGDAPLTRYEFAVALIRNPIV